MVLSYLGASIDDILNSFVSTVSSQVSTGIAPLVTTGVTVWIILYGYAVMRQEVSDPINVFVGKAIRISLIMICALSAGFYQANIVSFVQSVQDGLVSIVQPSGSKLILTASGSNIWEVLDEFSVTSTKMGMVVILRGVAKMPIGGWVDLVAGLLIFSANSVLLLVCAGFLLLAKVASSLLLALGPLFIALLAFPATQRFFDSWLGAVANYVLLIVLLSVAVAFCIVISDTYIEHAFANIDDSNVSQLGDAFDMVVLYGSMLFVLMQIPHIASSLTGGASLSGGGAGQLAGAWLMGKSMKGDKAEGSGGSITGGSSGGGAGKSKAEASDGGGDTPSPKRVPAFRRAAQRRTSRRN